VKRTYFTDRDLGRHIFPGVLVDAGVRVQKHADHFAHDTPDEEWLSVVALRGWIALTMDNKMTSRATAAFEFESPL
jgi:hypothetical protein